MKLDELLRCLRGPRTALVGLEDLSDEQLNALQKEFERIRSREDGLPEQVAAIEQVVSERRGDNSSRHGRPRKARPDRRA